MEIKTYSDIKDCERLWKKFSTNQIIWDDWDLINALFDPKFQTPFFLVIVDNNKEVGLLPLLKEKKTGDSMFFGGCFPECRRLWFDPKYFKFLFTALPENTILFDIMNSEANKIIEKWPEYKEYFSNLDYRYFIRIDETWKNIDDFLKLKLSGDRRKKLRNNLKKVDNLGINVKWSDEIYLKEFINFNKIRFGIESDFADEENSDEAMRLITRLKEKGMLISQKISIGNDIKAVSMSAFDKGIYHVFYGSFDQSINNLGKRMRFNNINKAIELKATEVDFMVGDPSGWKQFWKMDKEESICFKK